MSNIQSVLNETRVFPPAEAFVKQANVSGMAAYQAMVDAANKDYAGYWANLARENILWHKPFTKSLDESKAPFYKWFEDGELNVSFNCLDKHLALQADKTAIIFEAEDGKVTKVSYQELHSRVCHFANGLKSRGTKKGDRVVVYMPMSNEALAMGGGEAVHSVIVYRRTGGDVQWNGNNIWWHDLVAGQGNTCEPEWVGAEHPLFILYTSGSTGKPKGVQHSTGGFLLHAMVTMKWVFDYR